MTVATLHPFPPEAVQLGVALPFALRDANGALIAARGVVIRTEEQLQSLTERELYLDEQDSETFARLHGRVSAYLQGRDLYVQDCFAGADHSYRIPIRVITEFA